MRDSGKRAPGKKKLRRIRRRYRAERHRRLRSEALETRQLLAAHPLHNEVMPTDVNQDNAVTPADALVIINQLNRQGRGEDVVEGEGRPVRMIDVNNDGRATAIDALMVINRLNRRGPSEPSFDSNTEAPRDPRDPQPDGSRETPDSTRDTDVVLEWNHIFGELLVLNEENQNPGYASRSMAMLNLAIYDSVAIANGELETAFHDYSFDIQPNSPLRADVVASQAAYTVLGALYPDQQEVLDDFLMRAMQGADRNAETAASIEVGTLIGQEVVASRAGDGWNEESGYTYHDEVGDFQPDPLNPDVPVWGPSWGKVDPFVISSNEDYAPDSPPSLTSETYAASYNEVQELGAVDSETRTADQTEAGLFWAYDRTGMGTPIALFSNILETIAVQEGNSLSENAALFAQASVAMADAGIVAWHTKFTEQFWRPVTAIQQGDLDSNPLTTGDSDWTALGAPDGGDDIVGFTPQFPTYISGHATFGGALFGAIREFYGTDDISFDVTSNELAILMENPDLQAAYGIDLDDATRSFSSLTEAMEENGRSRVYLGIHFDFDDLIGQSVGQAVAESVSSQFPITTASGTSQPPSRPSGGHEGGSTNPMPGGRAGDGDGMMARVDGGPLAPPLNPPAPAATEMRDAADSTFEEPSQIGQLTELQRMDDGDLETLAQDQVRRRRDGPLPEDSESRRGSAAGPTDPIDSGTLRPEDLS